MQKKNFRRLSILVTAQTASNLEKLCNERGYSSVGRVVDDLVRREMMFGKKNGKNSKKI